MARRPQWAPKRRPKRRKARPLDALFHSNVQQRAAMTAAHHGHKLGEWEVPKTGTSMKSECVDCGAEMFAYKYKVKADELQWFGPCTFTYCPSFKKSKKEKTDDRMESTAGL